MTVKEAAQQALHVQSACNLSGVVHIWHEVATALWDEANKIGKGTDWVNHHPINILFVTQVAHLTKFDSSCVSSQYSEAYKECKRLAKEE